MGPRKFNLTERNIYALDYNCHLNRALASGLYRPLWRGSDPSSARDCRRCARYSADSRQTRALSESVFAPGSISGASIDFAPRAGSLFLDYELNRLVGSLQAGAKSRISRIRSRV